MGETKKMRLLLLVLIAILCISSASALKCKTKTLKNCKRVRVAPFTKLVRRKKKVTLTQKFIKRTKVAYKHRVCRTKFRKVPYQIPYRTQIKVKVKLSKKYTKRHWRWVHYLKPLKKRRKKYYIKKYTVLVKKAFKIKKKVKKFKKIKVKRNAICLRKRKTKKFKYVKKPYNSKCPKKITAIKYVIKTIIVKKNFKKLIWTGRYYDSGTPGCFKKKMIWKYYVKGVKVKKKVAVKYIKTIQVRCVKFKTVKKYYWKHWIQKYTCQKSYTKTVPYFQTITVTVHRMVREPRAKKLWKWESYTIKVKAKRKQY